MTSFSRLAALGVTALLVAAAPAVPTPADQSTPADQLTAADQSTAAGRSAPPAERELPVGVELVDVPTDGPLHVTPRTDLRSLLLDAVDPRDPTDLFEAVSRHVAEAWDATDVLAAQSDEGPTAMPVPIAGGTFVEGRAALDTDGDGLDDEVLTATDAATGATDLVALRGTDGHEQWRTPLASWDEAVGWPAGDLTGDGIEDLFALDLAYDEFTADEQCDDDDNCEGFIHATYTWRLSARSGADGGLLWQEAHPGEYRVDYVDRQTEDGSEYSWTVEAEDLASLPYPGADHDGDGGRDVLVNTIDLTESFTETSGSGATGTGREGAYDLDSSTTARIVRGADGGDIVAALTSQGPSIAVLRLAGDATDDGIEDLLWSRVEYDTDTWSCQRYVVAETCDDEEDAAAPQLHLDLLDGSNLSTAWSFAAPVANWLGYAIPLSADLDGVPGTDILVRVRGEDEPLDPADPLGLDEPADDLVLLSGRDGAAAWRIDSPGFVAPWAVAEMGGATGPDVLLSGASIGTTFCSSSVPTLLPDDCQSQTTATQTALRFDGTTGEQLSDTSRTYDLGSGADYHWFSFSSYAGDHDGDEVADPRMALGTSERSVAVVQSAVTGDPLFEHVGEDQLLLAFGGGDLDGTGTDELGTYRLGDGRFQILRMPGGELLHDLTTAQGAFYAGGDQDGVRGDELVRVLHTLDEAGQVHATVESLHGETLAPRWSRPLTAG